MEDPGPGLLFIHPSVLSEGFSSYGRLFPPSLLPEYFFSVVVPLLSLTNHLKYQDKFRGSKITSLPLGFPNSPKAPLRLHRVNPYYPATETSWVLLQKGDTLTTYGKLYVPRLILEVKCLHFLQRSSTPLDEVRRGHDCSPSWPTLGVSRVEGAVRLEEADGLDVLGTLRPGLHGPLTSGDPTRTPFSL